MNKIMVFLVALLSASVGFAKCNGSEKTVFSCLTAKAKQIEVCDAGKTISYSFGYPNAKPEIVVAVPRGKASTLQGGAGRYTSYAINVPNGSTVYRVFWSMDRLAEEHSIEAGVNVEIKHKLVATVKCVGEKSIFQAIEGIELREEG